MKKILKKIALFSFLLALLAGSVAFFYFERSDFSEADIKVELMGDDEVKAGETVEYKVRATNNTNSRLENVELIFEYPEASIPIEDDQDKVIEKEETFRRVEDLGEMNPGEEEVIDFKAIILGKKDDEVKAKAWFNYQPQNLTSTYEIERTKTGIITEVPINFEFDTPDQVEADEEFPFRLRYYSKIDQELMDIGIRIKYPNGFEFVRSTPQGVGEEQWQRDSLGANEGGIIEIFGKLQGEYGDIKGFEAELGVWKFDRFISLKKIEEEILIPQPNLFVDVLVNDSSSYVAETGEDLLYDVYFKNIGDETLEELFLTVDLDKANMNMDEVEPMRGRFQKAAGSIIWSHSSISDLRRLRPDEERKLSFWSKVKEGDLSYNPEIIITANLGKTIQEKRTKINTEVNVSQEFVKDDFVESVGPLPFRLNRESNYVVKWEIENLYNDLEDVTLSATLPEGSSLGKQEVSDESQLSLNGDELTWEIEKVERGSGLAKEPITAYFEIKTKPQGSVDSDMELISNLTIRGKDAWTREIITDEAGSLIYGDLLEFFEVDSSDSRKEIEFNNDN